MAITLPTVTGYSAFYELTGDKLPYAMIPTANGGGRSPLEYGIARLFARSQLRALRAVMIALNGAAAGGNAQSTYSRVQPQVGPDAATPVVTAFDSMGGTRPIETATAIDRVTTASDEAYVDDILDGDLTAKTISYPTVVGSGGGGKLVNGAVSF